MLEDQPTRYLVPRKEGTLHRSIRDPVCDTDAN